MNSIFALAVCAAAISAVYACDDTHGMHCLSGKWECPGDIFDKVGRDITDTFCSNKCCLCVKKSGTGRCTPDDLKPNQEIFINPNFQDFPKKGTCQWCPKGTEKQTYTHKCFDQRSVGFDSQLNDCSKYPLVPGFLEPNGVGNVPPLKVNIAASFNKFAPISGFKP